MAVQTVELAGKRFVILPESDYRRLRRRAGETDAQEAGDIAESKRRSARGPSRPYSELRKKLGLR